MRVTGGKYDTCCKHEKSISERYAPISFWLRQKPICIYIRALQRRISVVSGGRDQPSAPAAATGSISVEACPGGCACLPAPAFAELSVLERRLVRYGQLLATLGATRCQYLAAVGGSHSLTESVLVDSLTARRLISSFHCHSCIVFLLFIQISISAKCYYAECKGTTIFHKSKKKWK
mgnify:FL=1